MRFAIVSCAVLAASACSDREPPAPPAARAPLPPRRVIEPPTGIVRPLPPHAIRADGVGPYKLGDPVAALLQQLPSGPRIVRFEIPDIVRTSIIRAEDDTVLIGGETTSTATFVAVVGSEVARTESGVHVGSSVDELTQAFGPPLDAPDRARDPRLVIPAGQRSLRVVLDDRRIIAIVVMGESTPRELPKPPCELPVVRAKPGTRSFPACLSTNGEIIEVTGDDVIVRGPTGEHKLAAIRIPNLVFAEPLRIDGRDELVAISTSEDPQERRWSLSLYRLDGGRLAKVIDGERLYELSSAQTRWIGADLRAVELYLEVASRTDRLEVGGLLTTMAGDKVRDVAVISPVFVRRPRIGKVVAGEPADAGVPGDAEGPAADSAKP